MIRTTGVPAARAWETGCRGSKCSSWMGAFCCPSTRPIASRSGCRRERRATVRAFLPWGVLIVALFAVGLWIVFQPMQMRGTLPGRHNDAVPFAEHRRRRVLDRKRMADCGVRRRGSHSALGNDGCVSRDRVHGTHSVSPGPVEVSVLVQDAKTGEAVTDAIVTLRLFPRDNPSEVRQYAATTAAATNKLFYSAPLDCPRRARGRSKRTSNERKKPHR